MTDDSKTTEPEFPLGSIYSREDSESVRKAYYEATQGHPPRRTVITEREWKKFEKQGRDMAKYVTLAQIRIANKPYRF